MPAVSNITCERNSVDARSSRIIVDHVLLIILVRAAPRLPSPAASLLAAICLFSHHGTLDRSALLLSNLT